MAAALFFFNGAERKALLSSAGNFGQKIVSKRPLGEVANREAKTSPASQTEAGWVVEYLKGG